MTATSSSARTYLDSTTRRQPPKSEFRRPKPERTPNTEGRSHAWEFRVSGFGLLSALGFRASGLGLCAHGLVVLSRYATCSPSVLHQTSLSGAGTACHRLCGLILQGQAVPAPFIRPAGQFSCEITPVRMAKRTSPATSKIFKPS